MSERLYFRQLLSGRDIAQSDMVATQMVNFVYLIGDLETRECLVVDPAYSIPDIVATAEADGMEIKGVLATHYHPDHLGGDMFGHEVQGVRELLEVKPIKVHVNRDEVTWVKRVTGLSDSDLDVHDSGDVVKVGEIECQLVHTPGHTPGSQCFFVENRLVAGDTLFLQGCGRTDLPGGDARQLYLSLTQKLAEIPDDALLFPGHLYSDEPSGTMGETRQLNFVFRPRNEAEWLAMFGQ